MVARRYPPPHSEARRRPCIDCRDEGITTQRKAPHPGPRCATHHRIKRRVRSTVTWAQRLWEKYGITEEDYWSIYEFQHGTCYLCRRATGVRKRLSVDHDHESGEVRGLLCLKCNRDVLGHARDEIGYFQRAIDYLTNPPARQALGGPRYVPE